MAEKFFNDIVVSASTEHFDTAEKALQTLGDLIDTLGERGVLSEKDMKRLSRSFLDVERSASNAASALRSVSQALDESTPGAKELSGWDKFQKTISSTQEALQDLMRERAAAGSQTPYEDVRELITDEDLNSFERFEDTKTNALRRASKERTKLREEEAQAAREAAKSYQEAFTDPKSFLGQANSADASLGLKARDTSWAQESREVRDATGSYHNLSTAFDDVFRARQRESATASATIRARMEEDAATRNLGGSLPTLRYAMYDIARTSGALSAAFTASGTAAVVASAQYESAFAAVERTSGVTGNAVNDLKQEFVALTREIPQSFKELANIGARGAQLGVLTEDLESFTNTVAKFVATSDTVTLNEAVEAFGRISNLLGDRDFNRIGSAITLVGVNAAATEAQIVKTTQELAPFATAVGMTTDETIGLAAALGSLGQPPERARSAFLTLQRVMDNAIASGSDNLYAFSDLLGITAEETARLWKQDPGQFIESFSKALGEVDNLTTAFADLGINERRAVQVFQALAADARNAGDGMSVLERAFQDANQGYREGTELARQYVIILKTLVSKWEIFKNSVAELAMTMGNLLAPAAKAALDFLTKLIQGFTKIVNSPVGKVLTGVAIAVGALVAAASGLLAMVALITGSMLAMATALKGLNIEMGRGIFSANAMRSAFTQLGTAMGYSTAQVNAFRTALIRTGIGAVVVGLGFLISAMVSAGDATNYAEEALNKFFMDTGGFSDAVAQDTADYVRAVEEGNKAAADSYIQISSEMDKVAAGVEEVSDGVKNAATILGVEAPEAIDQTTEALKEQSYYLGENSIQWVQSALLQSEAFQKLAANEDFLNSWVEMGIDFHTVMQIAAAEGYEGVMNYFRALSESSENGSIMYLKGWQLFWHRLKETFRAIADLIANAWSDITSGRLFQGKPVAFGSFAVDIGTIWSKEHLNNAYREIAQATSALTAFQKSTSSAARAATDAEDDFTGMGDGLGNAGKGAKDAAREIRTLTDYANDLSKVWSRAFEIRFSGQQTLDTITSAFIKIREENERAAKAIRDLKNTIRSLQSDISIQEYYLSIAVEYGDTKRAQAIEAELAKKRAELADKSQDLRTEQDKLNKGLKGNTSSAIDNRKTILDLLTSYQNHLKALAAAGVSQGRLEKESQRLRKEFVSQATALGFSRDELKDYEATFLDVSKIINAVPFAVTTDLSSLDPALLAIREFADEANKALKSMGDGVGDALGGALGGGAGGAGGVVKRESENLGNTARNGFIDKVKDRLGPLTAGALYDGILAGKIPAAKAARDTGHSSVDGFVNEFRQFFPPGFSAATAQGILSSRVNAATGGANLGAAAGSNLNSSFRNNLNLASGVAAGAAAAQWTATANASSLGSSMAHTIRSALTITFNSLLGFTTIARRFVHQLTGFAQGGYTGAGGRNEIAGLVHRGEYVIPKHEVNQSTGLPHRDALGRMMNGLPGSGGNRGSSAGVQYLMGKVDLSAATIQELAQVMDKIIVVNGQVLGDVTSDAYAHSRSVGRY